MWYGPSGDAAGGAGIWELGFVYRFRGPGEAWQLTSEPVCICRPSYGWDRIDTTVDEGPFAVERGDDLFVTFAGSSVSVLYCVGLLHAKLAATC